MAKFVQTLTGAACALLAIGAAACASPSAAPPLNTVAVPPGSTLEMSRAVALAVTTSAAILPAGAVGSIEVQRADGAVLFDGPMVANQATTSNLALANDQSHLTVVLHVPGKADATLDVVVASNNATASFQ